MIVGEGASAINERFYDEFWQSCPDFSRYNPGVLHRRRVILELLRMTSHAAPHGILDVGCGNGELLMWLRSVFGDDTRLNGADLSRETIEENKKRHPFATFYDLNVETSSLDDSFAVVLCTEVIEHLDDRRHAIENLAKMVAPGGHLILTCPTGKLHSTEAFRACVTPDAEGASVSADCCGTRGARAESVGLPALYSHQVRDQSSSGMGTKDVRHGAIRAARKASFEGPILSQLSQSTIGAARVSALRAREATLGATHRSKRNWRARTPGCASLLWDVR